MNCEWYDDRDNTRCRNEAQPVEAIVVALDCGHEIQAPRSCSGHIEALAGERLNQTPWCRTCRENQGATLTPNLRAVRR